MPKKISILSALIGLSISTIGCTVPTFADINDTGSYTVSDLVPLHTEYANAMAECGPYKTQDAVFNNCYNAVTSNFRARYGGKFEAMYQLDYNGRMVVSAINPTAGTVRFYVDETRAYTGDSFTFENLVIFWADSWANPSPYWDDDAAWIIADTILNEETVPIGVHLLYKGVRGEDGWATINAENRTTFVNDSDFIRESVPRFFFVLGYDSLGNKHIERNAYSGCVNASGGFTEGKECRLEYYYDGSHASSRYVEANSITEDATLIEINTIIKNAREAEQSAREAEQSAREAEQAAREAEQAAREAEAVANETLSSAIAAEAAAIAATESAREAESVASEATAIAREAEQAAREAEASARENEIRAIEAETSARAAEANAAAAENAARAAEAESKRLAAELIEAATTASQAADMAISRSEEAVAIATQANEVASEAKMNFASKINELNTKIATLFSRMASPETKTIYVSSPSSINQNTTNDSLDSAAAGQDIKENIDVIDSTLEKTIETPLTGDTNDQTSRSEFPWWIIAFTFSGIILILWWCVPTHRK